MLKGSDKIRAAAVITRDMKRPLRSGDRGNTWTDLTACVVRAPCEIYIRGARYMIAENRYRSRSGDEAQQSLRAPS